jgi:hypothetical protein
MERRGISGVSPQTLLGPSPVASAYQSKDAAREYEQGSLAWQIIRDEAKIDGDLYNLLVQNGIDPSDPSTASISKRNTLLRKIKPLVLHRHAFRKTGSDGQSLRRSRKIAPVFCGWQTVFDVSEGNPRWLIGIVDRLIPEARKGKKKATLPIAAANQARVLTSVSQEYCSLLSALPEALIPVDNNQLTLYGLVKAISRHFEEEIILSRFRLDPPGSFTVDSSTPPSICELLRVAAYNGAIVYIDPKVNAFDADIINKRFPYQSVYQRKVSSLC